MKLQRLLCLLWGCGCLHLVHAHDIPVRYLGIEHGLSNNAVTNIYQDRQGFLWFGTYDGLNRYDGYGFKIYRSIIGDSNSLVNNSVYTLEGDAAQNLWVGSQKGVCVLNAQRTRFTRVRYMPARDSKLLPLQDNTHILKACGHVVFAGTNHTGLIVFESPDKPGRQVFLGDGPSGQYDVTAIECDTDNKLIWVFVQQRGLYQYDLKNGSLQLVNASIRQANCLRLTKAGMLWLGNEDGLFGYDRSGNSYTTNQLPGAYKIVDVKEDKEGCLWIASDGGGLFTKADLRTPAQSLTGSNGSPIVNSNAVYSVYVDVDGNKWIGTLRGGVNLIESTTGPFQTINYKNPARNSAASNFILSFCEDEQHNVWIGTDGAGLRYWNRHQNEFTDYVRQADNPHSISSNFITSILQDSAHNTWISTWFGGINRLNKNGKDFTRYTCYNPVTHNTENNVWLLYQDRQGRLWASATNDGCLYQYNKEADRFELFSQQIQNLQCIAEDSEGNLWAGNYAQLIRIDPRNKDHRFYNIGYTVRSIHEDRYHHLWIGTQEGGLLLFDRKTGQYQQFSTKEGLPGNTVLRMLEDQKGNLWISTFSGLSRFNIEKRYFRNFSQSDGLQSDQFSFNAAAILQSGEFVFGGIKGFNIFYPDSVVDAHVHRNSFLTGLSIDNMPTDQNSQYILREQQDGVQDVTIPFEKADISLDYVTLAYTNADKVRYAYLLEGWDKNWNTANMIRTARYSRLHEGEYTFYVKVQLADGGWSEPTALLHITVLPPWYRTWLAYSFYILLAGLLIYLYILYTKRQERLRYEIKLAHIEHEKEKDLTERKLSFFTNISHEFRTPLSLIINPIQEVLQHKEENKEKQVLQVAYRNARRLLSLTDQLLLFRKADSGADKLKISRLDIVSLCSEVYQCFVQQAQTKHIAYELTIPEEGYYIYGDYEKIEIALFNLLSNAFKFTPDGGKIGFTVETSAEGVRLGISDSGCGIAATEQEKIFEKFHQAKAGKTPKMGFGIGLYLVKHFIESQQGSVQVASTPGEGTRFTVVLPKEALRTAGSSEEAGDHGHELLKELTDELPEQSTGLPTLPVDQGQSADELLTEKKALLVVDDNKEIREYLAHLFQERYIVYTADNGLAGLGAAQHHVPDLIISDINMDGLNGLELCQRTKELDQLCHIPVILLTGSTSQESKLKGIENGADDYITKPFDAALLVAKVEGLLKNRHLLQRYYFESITLHQSAIKVPAEYQEFLQRCIEVVEENMDLEDFSTLKFAKAMGMSRSALYKKVKHISGQSLNAFIRSIRLRRAAVLMLKENMNINQAAFQVGIGDARYFREQFVKLFGMVPSDYIKKYRHSFNGELNIIAPKAG